MEWTVEVARNWNRHMKSKDDDFLGICKTNRKTQPKLSKKQKPKKTHSKLNHFFHDQEYMGSELKPCGAIAR